MSLGTDLLKGFDTQTNGYSAIKAEMGKIDDWKYTKDGSSKYITDRIKLAAAVVFGGFILIALSNGRAFNWLEKNRFMGRIGGPI